MADNPVEGSGYSSNHEAAADLARVMGTQQAEPESQPDAPAATPKVNPTYGRNPETGKFVAKEPEDAEGAGEIPETPEDAEIEAEDANIEATDSDPSEVADGEQELPDTLNGLAEALDLTPDELSEHIKVEVSVNGEKEEVNLAELRAGYMKDASFRQKGAQQLERSRQLDERTDQLGQIEQKITAEMGPTLQAVQGILTQQGQRIEAMLDSDSPLYNPDGYRAAKQQFDQQVGLYQQANRQMQETQQRQQAEQVKKHQREVREAEDKLAEMFPAWAADPETGKRDIRGLRDFAHENYGIPRELADSFYKPEYFMLISDAKAYRQLQADKPESLKRIRKAPKALKAGAKKASVDPNTKRYSANLGKLRKSGGRDINAAAGAIGAVLRRSG